jgi:diguanylate cyclase (GGDEF)-like protein
VKKAILIGLFLALVFFVAAASVSISKISAHRETDVERSHAFDVIQKLDGLVSTIMEAETAWSNYNTTRELRYLEAHRSAINKTIEIRDQLKKIYSREHVNLGFEELFVLINGRIEILSELMDPAAGPKVQAELLHREEVVSNALFLAIQNLERDETAEIIALDATMDVLSRQSIYALLAGTLLSVITFSGLFYLLHRELQKRKILEQAIKRQAHSDPLTGLSNRFAFMERLDYEITQANRSRERLAILYLDLDRFKEINDSLGHEAGDTLLKEVAQRVRANTRESDTVARIGGDEFNILLINITNTDNVSLIAEKVIGSFEQPFTISGQEIQSSCSIGISIYPGDGESAGCLLKNADIALYHAKEQGRNNYKFYNHSLNRRIVKKMTLENSLRRTLEKNELVLHYQPRLDIMKNKLICAEALVRWRHPDMGLLSPPDFIPLAEGIGFISSLDEWVLRTACTQARAWSNGEAAMCLTINISPREFKKVDLAAVVSGILHETGFDPHKLQLEISEQTAMEDIANTAAKVAELGRLGIRVAIDHFGAAYSSLRDFKMLSLCRVKIDRSFIKEIVSSRNDRAIIRAMIVMAHDMGIKIVADGVETHEQMRFLRATGCDEVQGYLVCRPVPVDEFTQFAASYGIRAA